MPGILTVVPVTEVIVVDPEVVVMVAGAGTVVELDVGLVSTVVAVEGGIEVALSTEEVLVSELAGNACSDPEQPANNRVQPNSPNQHDRLYIKRSFGSFPTIPQCRTPSLGRTHSNQTDRAVAMS